jgi:hypothetical protein
MTSWSWRLLAIRRATVQRLRSVATSHAPMSPFWSALKTCFGLIRRLGNQVFTSSPGPSAIRAGRSCFSNQARAPPARFTWDASAGVSPPLKRLTRCRSAAASTTGRCDST